MKRASAALSVGTFSVAALTLAVAATPAMANGHTPKLAHTHLTLKATHQKVTPNGSFKATVVATLRAKHDRLAGEPVELFQRAKGATWTDSGTGATTDTTGAASFSFVQSATNQQYRVVFAGDDTYRASHSGAITIHKLKAAD